MAAPSAPPRAAFGAADAELRAACDALAADLRARAAGAPTTPEARGALKAEIVALIRAAAAGARAFAALEADARALAGLWKALPPEPPAAVAPNGSTDDGSSAVSNGGSTDAAVRAAGGGAAPGSRSARRTSRADHLGASTYAARGWTAYAAGDYAAAESAYARAAALAPDDAEAAALHGWTLAALGRDDDALLAAHRVLTAHPPAGAAALARVALGRVCLHKGITGEALEHLTRVTRDDADRRATLYATFHLGVAYGQRGMHDAAVTFLRRALALGPNLVEAQYELGRAHWQAGAPEAAHEAWRAGAAAGKFSPWAARCEALRLHMAGGGALPAAS